MDQVSEDLLVLQIGALDLVGERHGGHGLEVRMGEGREQCHRGLGAVSRSRYLRVVPWPAWRSKDHMRGPASLPALSAAYVVGCTSAAEPALAERSLRKLGASLECAAIAWPRARA